MALLASMRNTSGHCKVFVLLLVTFLTLQGSLTSEEFEYKLKAEFIERFTRFIDWPARSSAHDGNGPFDICVAGTNPFGDYLAELARDVKKIKHKTVRIRYVKKDEELQTCHVLFIASSEANHLSVILDKTSDSPVLTVGDTPGFAEKGVLINFYRSGNYVRFEINNGAAHRSGLRFSSRLLKLARLVDSPGLPQGTAK
jgi:hypothetical protein